METRPHLVALLRAQTRLLRGAVTEDDMSALAAEPIPTLGLASDPPSVSRDGCGRGAGR